MISQEALDEVVFQTMEALRSAQPAVSLPFCVFNGGRDVWVDIGAWVCMHGFIHSFIHSFVCLLIIYVCHPFLCSFICCSIRFVMIDICTRSIGGGSGNKAVAVQILQIVLGLAPGQCLHVGDQVGAAFRISLE